MVVVVLRVFLASLIFPFPFLPSPCLLEYSWSVLAQELEREGWGGENVCVMRDRQRKIEGRVTSRCCGCGGTMPNRVTGGGQGKGELDNSKSMNGCALMDCQSDDDGLSVIA